MGFFGVGIRKDYDKNFFLTGNIVPFHTGGTYPIDDLTSRVDVGVSKRSDNETKMLRLGVEKGKSEVDTGVHFFNHMLDQLAKHSLMDLKIKAKGDIEVDYHHTVEDVGYALSQSYSS
mgnify:CR=1 FL=1